MHYRTGVWDCPANDLYMCNTGMDHPCESVLADIFDKNVFIVYNIIYSVY